MLNPIAFRVLIKPDPIKKKTASGILIETDKEVEENAVDCGIIVSIGPDVFKAFKPTLPFAGLQIGMRVAFARYAGKRVFDPETKEKLLIVNDEDIVAEIKGEVPNDIYDPLLASQKA